jgi:hypothetical protein
MLYEEAQRWLGWPNRDQAFSPEGAGPRVHAEYAQKKIGGALKLAHPGVAVTVGVIAPNPTTDLTEAPLAVVCEFPRGASDEELNLAHRLAWNFSRTALLITLEPHQLIAWSCHQDPNQPDDRRRVCSLPTPEGFTGAGHDTQVRSLLHWVSLLSNRIQQDRPGLFPSDGRADALLLKNLRYIRKSLLDSGLAKEFCHDLLARVIFAQFLFHRKDGNGEPFFSERLMTRLHDDGLLSAPHASLVSVLQSKRDTYALFRWMDTRFNGDLFPGKAELDEDARAAAWRAEKTAVRKTHLDLLGELISGNIDSSDRQLALWPMYSFDTLPLEFISSVYEEFLTEEKHVNKAYYTPSHLVDYVLDAVLPWNNDEWNLRILDPCCGSGIFLVKAFQRLIHRWRRCHHRDPLVSDIKPILAHNIVGVDKDPEAIRVACFSLYLAMADAIEPKHYVTREDAKVFPPLRGKRLFSQDFFDEATEGFRTKEDAASYDLIIGNAPWGDGSIKPREEIGSTKAQNWARDNDWPVPNHDIGPVFLGKAAQLVGLSGRVAMVQTASILYWRDGLAKKLRGRLFDTLTFDEITNLSAIRHDLFAGAIGPACVLVFGAVPPKHDTTLQYIAPKPTRGQAQSGHAFVIEPHDVSSVTHHEAATDPLVWPILALGGRRDLILIRRLLRLPNLSKLRDAGAIAYRMGIIPGNRKKELPELRGKRYFDARKFPDDVLLHFRVESVPRRAKIYVDTGHGVKDLQPFKVPQLLIKQSLSAQTKRFGAALVETADPEWGVVCKKTYLSVCDLTQDARHIRSACIVYNSQVATYFLGLTSSRIAHYNTETLSNELTSVPLPTANCEISDVDSIQAVDEETRRLFDLTPADWYLIEDFVEHTLPSALQRTPGASHRATSRRGVAVNAAEPDLSTYATTFARVVRGTFGNDKSVTATIYADSEEKKLPVRMVTIHLDSPDRGQLIIQDMDSDGLLDQLARFARDVLAQSRPASGGLGFQRVAYLFHAERQAGQRTMHLTIVKPDQRRYWTRSMAMRDADQMGEAILRAAAAAAEGRSE